MIISGTEDYIYCLSCTCQRTVGGGSILDEVHCRNIIGLLKDAQKGLSIEEISKKLNLSRITTAKYLNSLFVAGQVNMRKAGPAKVYTLSTRLPAEQILSQSSDLILVLDETYTVRNVSDSFLQTFGISNDQIENLDINTTLIGPGLIDRLRDSVKKGMAGKAAAVNAWIPVQKEWRAFRIRIIPLVFSWGAKGVVLILEDRTEEIMAQEENTFLADLVDASPAAITVSDFDGNFLYSNKKNLDLHGYSLGEFLAMNLEHLDNPESARLLNERLEELKKSGENSFEVVHVRKDEQQIPLEVHSKIARWGDRDVVIGIATDISERKRAERVLKESERRFADIINFLPDATYVVNGEGTVIAWNHAIEDLTGVKAHDIVGKGDHAYAIAIHGERRPILLDLIFNDDPGIRKHYRHLRKNGNTFTAETVLDTPDAGERILWLKASPFYDRDGRIAGAIESIRDITDRKRAEEELRKSEHKFATVFKSNPVSLTLVSAADGVFVDVNDTFLIHTGFDREEVIGKTAENLGIFADNDVYTQMVSQLRNKGHTEGLELRCRIKNGEIRTCLFSSSVILMGARPHILSTVEDITERKRAEEVRQQQTRALALLNTLAIELASMPSGKPVEKIILKTLMKMSGAAASWFSDYDPADRTLRVTAMEIAPGTLKKVVHLLGNRPFDLRIPVSNEMYREITHTIIGKKKTLTEVSFGQIPPLVSTGIQKLVGIDRLIGIACVIEEQLYGISMLAMKAGEEDPPTEILESFSHIVAVSLRRRRAETALMESEEKFRALFENANDAVYLVERARDGPGRYILVNDEAVRMLGYSKDELLKMSPRDIVPEDIAKKIMPEIRKKLASDGYATFESANRRKDGSAFPIEISIRSFRYQGKDVDLSIVRDITERKASELAFHTMARSMVGTTGMESLDRITESIGTWLGADCIMIGEITPDCERVRVLSMLLDGKKIPDFSYTLKGTPCENTMEKGYCIYPDEVSGLFPESRDLRELNIRGYIGTPLRNFEGQVVGILCILTRKPLSLPPSVREIIEIIAVKAAFEIGNRRARKDPAGEREKVSDSPGNRP
jgi:PAS domain S-box-containing protein